MRRDRSTQAKHAPEAKKQTRKKRQPHWIAEWRNSQYARYPVDFFLKKCIYYWDYTGKRKKDLTIVSDAQEKEGERALENKRILYG